MCSFQLHKNIKFYFNEQLWGFDDSLGTALGSGSAAAEAFSMADLGVRMSFNTIVLAYIILIIKSA